MTARLDWKLCGLSASVFLLFCSEVVIETLNQSSTQQYILKSELWSQNCESELCSLRTPTSLMVKSNICECSLIREWLALPSTADSAESQWSMLQGLGCDMAGMPASPQLWLTTICILVQHRCCLNLSFEVLNYLLLDSCEALHLHYHVFKVLLYAEDGLHFCFLDKQQPTCRHLILTFLSSDGFSLLTSYSCRLCWWHSWSTDSLAERNILSVTKAQ